MTENDLHRSLELVEGALLAVAAGLIPDDETERDRCRELAERVASAGRRVVDLLARPPRAQATTAAARPVAESPAELEARVVAEIDRVIDEAREREEGS